MLKKVRENLNIVFFQPGSYVIKSGGGIPIVMSPNVDYAGSNRKTFLCNSKIITNLT